MLAQLVERNDGIVEVSGSIPLHSIYTGGRMRKIVLCLLLFCVIAKLCYSVTEGFSISNILSTHPFHSTWEIPFNEEPLIPPQFTFFKGGGQCYTFLNEESQVLLKVFKQHHLRSYAFLRKIPFNLIPFPKRWPFLIDKFLKKREQKQPLLFASEALAYLQLRDHAGLLYLHLNPTTTLRKQITLIDKLGRAHLVDLDTLDFALQMKAELPEPHFLRLQKEQNLEAAKNSIDSLLSLITQRCAQGIRNQDPCLRRNCGFIENTAIDIDIGSFVKEEALKLPFVAKNPLYYETRSFHHWLKDNYPEANSYFTERLKQLLYTKQPL